MGESELNQLNLVPLQESDREEFVLNQSKNEIEGNSFEMTGFNHISPLADIHKSAFIGPGCSIGSHTKIGEGCRIISSIILDDAIIEAHSVIKNSIIGWNATVGPWCRIEGIGPTDPVSLRDHFLKSKDASSFNNIKQNK